MIFQFLVFVHYPAGKQGKVFACNRSQDLGKVGITGFNLVRDHRPDDCLGNHVIRILKNSFSTSSQTICPNKMWFLYPGVSVEGMLNKKSEKTLFSPGFTVKQRISCFCRATSNALTIFPELPEVDKPTRTSPACAIPRIRRA